jgi:hypothetical protein
MTHDSTVGTQDIPQKVLAFSQEVDECEPLEAGHEWRAVDATGHRQGLHSSTYLLNPSQV